MRCPSPVLDESPVAGSVEEFVAHCIENELKKLKVDEVEGQVADQLRGLGYIE